MVEVIPAINAKSFAEVMEKIKLVEPHVKSVHIDVADGTFTPNTLWHNPQDFLGFETLLFIEMHLMIADTDMRFADWILPPVSRIIFHAEAAHDPHFVIEKIRGGNKEVGVAIRPETDWQVLEPFCGKADLVQTLAVPPGYAGQEFRPETIEKVANIRKDHPNCIIEVDGGVNLETGKKSAEAGANILVAANYIFSAPDIAIAIDSLKNVSSY